MISERRRLSLNQVMPRPFATELCYEYEATGTDGSLRSAASANYMHLDIDQDLLTGTNIRCRENLLSPS